MKTYWFYFLSKIYEMNRRFWNEILFKNILKIIPHLDRFLPDDTGVTVNVQEPDVE